MRTGFLLLLFIPLFSFSQSSSEKDYQWWNDKHNWDGVTHWHQYMILEPGFMGPNALPVPEIQKGNLLKKTSLEIDVDLHVGKGDETQNIFLDLNILLSENVALRFSMVPIEFFQSDTLTRDNRIARDEDSQGLAVGDLYIGTQIVLVKNHAKWPDILLGINLKTASGNNLENARYTDTPGYFFDISAGKTYILNPEKGIYTRLFLMTGFYVYQTLRTDYLQNDAIMWGLGLDIGNDDWELSNQLGGYHGYFGAGDRPTVYRAKLIKKGEKINWLAQFQAGNNSYPFNSFRLGVRLDFSK